MNAVDEAKPPKTRHCNTRSRSGCVACREKHIRCDEKRPSCLNCAKKKLPCHYMPKIPLRERRTKTRPGQQMVWSVTQSQAAAVITYPNETSLMALLSDVMRPSGVFDPFDALPIKMPLRSKELLHYFFQAGYGFGPFPRNPDDWSAPAPDFDMDNPDLLQNTLLVSGIHYARNKGDLALFEPTFLYHKIQCIRQVNFWLRGGPDKNLQTKCARYISTLAITEACLGDFEAAESHLNGLVVYLDSKRLQTGQDARGQVEDELTSRYLNLAKNVLHSTASRVKDLIANYCVARGIKEPLKDTEYGLMKHKPHLHDTSGTISCLKATRMLPFFFGFLPTERMPKDVDMHMTVTVLRDLTRRADPRHTNRSAYTNWKVWHSGDTPRLLFALVDSHIESFSDKLQLPPQGRQTFISSWSSFCVTMSMYLTNVVELWNHGLPIERRLHYYTIRVLEDDIRNGYETLEHMDQETRYTWFWKAFVGSLTVAQGQLTNYDERLDGMFDKFSKYIKAFTWVEKMSSWDEAKRILVTVVWPMECTQDEICTKVWARLLAKH
ncbi:hypothetical protein FCIRC_3744 [Fusarium circinatum]|uniref:Zn(2)-C6 fungal-type domain-containing protein n=1 Tax=Fusarium circinatum TaxID=48490 RepID=A0A8H5U6G1_FUSCI|nr:hypothetical protein FCIRC_3744 [Fusarium circinatum]